MFKERDIITYTIPHHGMVSAIQFVGGMGWQYKQPDNQTINGMTALVEYADYSNPSYPEGWGYICSGNFQVAVSMSDLTRYSGIINPELLKRTW